MAGLLAYMALGGAKGAGESIAEQAKARREQMLKMLEMQRAHGLRMEERSFVEDRADQRQQRDIEAKKWLKSDLIQDASGAYYRVGINGRVEPLRDPGGKPVIGPLKTNRGAAGDGLSADNDRLLKRLEERFKHVNPETGVEEFDARGMREHLKKIGRGDLAALYPDMSESLDINVWSEALARARAEAEERAGLLSTDSRDFADWGGSRERFINERAMEIYEALKGGGRPALKDRRGQGGNTAQAAKPDRRGVLLTPPPSLLQEGKATKFKNGQVWTLRNGKPVRIE